MRETQILRGLGKARMAHQARVQRFAQGTAFAQPAGSMSNPYDEWTSSETSPSANSLVLPDVRTQYPGPGMPAPIMNARAAAPRYGRTPLPPTGAGAGQGLRGMVSATPETDMTRGGMLARNPGVAANQLLSPGAPTQAAPAAPAAPAMTGLKPNAFGDNTSFNSSFNPQQAVHGTTTMQQWSAPGRSNGNPNAQDMAAGDQLAATGMSGAIPRQFQRVKNAMADNPSTNGWSMDPLGTPNRGLKSASLGNQGFGQAFSRGTAMLEGPGTETSDSIPAMLSKGEAVLPAKTVKAIGPQNIAQMIRETNGKPPVGGLRAGGHYAVGDVPLPQINENMLPSAKPVVQPVGSQYLDPKLQVPQSAPAAPNASAAPANTAFEQQVNEAAARNRAAAEARVSAGVRTGGVPDPIAATTAEAPAAQAGGLRGRAQAAFNSVKNAVTGAAAAEAPAPTSTLGKAWRSAMTEGGWKGSLARGNLIVAPVIGAGKTLFASPEQHEEFANSIGANKNSLGTRTLEFLNNTGNAATFGLAGALGRGISNVANGGNFFDGESTSSAAAAQKPAPAEAPTAQGTPATPVAEGPKPGDVRSIGGDGILLPDGTMDRFNGKVWETVSSPQGKADRALKDAQYQNKLRADADEATNGLSGWKTQAANISAMRNDVDQQNMLERMTPRQQAEFRVHQLQATQGLAAAKVQADAHLRGIGAQVGAQRDIAAGEQGVQREGNQLSYLGKKNALDYERMIKGVEWGSDGAKDLDKAIGANINSQVPDASKPGQYVTDPGAQAGLRRYVDNSDLKVRTKMGDLPLHEAMKLDPAAANEAVSHLGAEYGLKQLASTYSKGGFFGRQAAEGRLKILGTKPIEASDFADNGTRATDAFLKKYIPGSYGNGLVVDAGNNRKIVVPFSEIANHPDSANILSAINKGLPRGQQVDGYGKISK